MVQIFLAPAQLGHAGVRRFRTFIFFWHRERTQYLYDVHDALDAIEKTVTKKVCTRPNDYMISSESTHAAYNYSFAQSRKRKYQPETRFVIHSCCNAFNIFKYCHHIINC